MARQGRALQRPRPVFSSAPDDRALFSSKNVAARQDYALNELSPYNASVESLRFVTWAP